LPSPPPSIELADQPLTYTLSVTDHVPLAADLALQVPGPVQVVPGGTTIYAVTLHNRGPALATGVVLTDVLPRDAIPLWTQPAQPVCGRHGRNVSCDLGDLRGSDAATVTLDLSVAGAETPITDVQLAEVAPDISMSTMTVGPTVTPTPTTTDLVLQADGPSSVIAGQPFTYTYTVTNRGALDATGVRFEDVVPPDTNLFAYAPGLPLCEGRDDVLTCYLRDLDSNETLTFTLVITGHAGQPMKMGLDPLMPGWPMCIVVKERTWQHVVHCELGRLKPGQATRVQLVLVAIGVRERMTANTASVSANEIDLNPLDNTNTATINVQAESTPLSAGSED